MCPPRCVASLTCCTKEVVKLDRISIVCLVNVNIEVTEKHELFRCCDIQFQVVGEFSDEQVVCVRPLIGEGGGLSIQL